MDEEYESAARDAKGHPAAGGRSGPKDAERITREDDRAIDRRGAIDPAVFRSALLRRFDRHRRPLPWRTDRNPYRVMVSEFMLQQTRAETVIPYYERWLRKFQGWRALAEAPLDDVILAWKGLGYYSRARNLHRTARAVRERYGGELPRDPTELRTLPGVGEYTAGAVASIAFGKAVPAVDGNVRRVLARLLDLPRPTAPRLRREAARLLDPGRPGDHNEAMMELGATVCTPRAPRCDECPVAAWCAALKAGTVAERPARNPRRPVARADYATVVALDPDGRALLVKRPPDGLLAGMWEFPSAELRSAPASPGDDPGPVAAALRHLAALGMHGRAATRLPSVRHAFTHLRATYHPVVVLCDTAKGVPCHGSDGTPRPGGAFVPRPIAWARPARLDDYALPVAQQKIGRLVEAWTARRAPRSPKHCVGAR